MVVAETVNAISVIDIGGFWPAKIRASVEAAAKRWGVDLIVTAEDLLPPRKTRCLWFNKYVLLGRLTGYDAVLQLDADMMISEAAPSPFDEHEAGKIGAVREYQPQYAPRRAKQFWGRPFAHVTKKWAGMMKMPPPPKEDYLNGGFLLYNPDSAKVSFDKILEYGAMVQWGDTGLSDQTIVSILAHNGVLDVQYMDSKWNAVHAGDSGALLGPAMDSAHIYHFCGPYNRAKRVAGIHWRNHEGVLARHPRKEVDDPLQ